MSLSHRVRASLTALLFGAGVAACTGSVDSTPPVDASNSPVEGDGQVAVDASNKDGGTAGPDGSTQSDSSVSGELDAQLTDGQILEPGDASVGTDSGTVVTPAGEPVFVAFGAGFWTATSCDRGRSWRLSQKSSDREDHGPWSAFGRMAFGKGTFVGATGWGAPGHVLASDTGLGFGNGMNLKAGTSGVGFTGTEFVLMTGDQVHRAPDGKSWDMGSYYNVLPGTNQIRYLRVFPETGVAIASIMTQDGNSERAPGIWTTYSTDGLRTWVESKGDFSQCAREIQGSGDIVAVGNTIMMGGQAGITCRSMDGGRNWQTSEPLPASPLRDLWTDGQSFYALAAKTVYRLEGGRWAPHGTLDIADTSAAGATSGRTTVVAAGAKFFWSDDFSTWTAGTPSADAMSAGNPLLDPRVRDMVVGYYPKACP